MIRNKIVATILPLLMAMVLTTPCQSIYAKTPRKLTTARRISTWGTVGSLVISGTAVLVKPDGIALLGAIPLAGIGVIYGPSSGHAYAGNTTRFFTGSSLRILAAGGVVAGMAMFGSGILDEGGNSNLIAPGIAVGALSLSTFVYTIIRDFTDLDDSVNAYNRANGFTSLQVRPTIFPGQEAAGFTLSIQF